MSPPRIMFDDGSRVMQDDGAQPTVSSHESQPSTTSARGTVPLQAYYEIDRVATEVVDKLDWSTNTSRGRILSEILAAKIAQGDANDSSEGSRSTADDGEDDKIVAAAPKRKGVATANGNEDDGFLCRIALQFPDELLGDAPEVSWLMETSIVNAYKEKIMRPILENTTNAGIGQEEELTSSFDVTEFSSILNRHLSQSPLLFILGDTTYGSCCPDEVSANHLNANVIVHYGYACLSPTESVPVVYAFGVAAVGTGEGDAGTAGADVATSDEDRGGNNHAIWKECVRLVSNEAACQGGQILVDHGNLDEALAQKMSINENQCKKLLILYEVKYHHAMDELKFEFEKMMGQFQVVVGAIPKQQLSGVDRVDAMPEGGGGGCGSGGCGCDEAPTAVVPASESGCCDSNNRDATQSSQSCCAKEDSSSCCAEAGENAIRNTTCDTKTADAPKAKDATPDQKQRIEKQYIPRTIGGLEIPDDLDLSQHTLLYIGDNLDIDSHDTGNNAARTLLHILLRCSAPDGPPSLWSYSPLHRRLIADILNSPLSPTNSTSLSTALSRTLRRRYFLLNKAKLATTIGVLIGTTSNSYSFRRVLSRTRRRIESTGRTAYTFAVGKLATSASKLTNFAEIDAFVLIACGESIAKFWKTEREEMLVPVLTPLELDVALGFREWDGRYSCDFGDLVRWDEADGVAADDALGENDDGERDDSNLNITNTEKDNDGNDSDSDSDDEPFFSMISGKYEQRRTRATMSYTQNVMVMDNNANDLQALPGQGKIIEYRSEAAEFLKKREYRGLEANVGETEAKAAVLGQVGIASNYGENH